MLIHTTLQLSSNGRSHAWVAFLQSLSPCQAQRRARCVKRWSTSSSAASSISNLTMLGESRNAGKDTRQMPSPTFCLTLRPTMLAAQLAFFTSLIYASYSLKNGMMPGKLAKHFGCVLFGLPEDETFARTYDAYVRASNATEHLLLAYIRFQATTTTLPPRLAQHINGYPSILPTEITLPSASSKLVSITQIERTVRLYSADLVHSACELDLVESCSEWEDCRNTNEALGKDPQLSDKFRKLINLRVEQYRVAGQAHPVHRTLSLKTTTLLQLIRRLLANAGTISFLMASLHLIRLSSLSISMKVCERTAQLNTRRSSGMTSSTKVSRRTAMALCRMCSASIPCSSTTCRIGPQNAISCMQSSSRDKRNFRLSTTIRLHAC